jgi:anti-anti-sigma factor
MSDVPAQGFVVRAPQEIDVATAPVLGVQLADALAGHGDVVLDCSEVTFCDSTAMRVLLAARRLARALEVTLHIADPPMGLVRIAAILGASELLGLPEPGDPA